MLLVTTTKNRFTEIMIKLWLFQKLFFNFLVEKGAESEQMTRLEHDETLAASLKL